MALAVRVLRRALIEDFGFEQLLFVYDDAAAVSHERWVCDSRARAMSNEVRAAAPPPQLPPAALPTGAAALPAPMA